jgi:T5SS/PEP-CTERM-associated repeat protein
LLDGIIGALSSGTGHVTVDGDGSGWDLPISGRLYVGSDGQGTLGISGGGTVQNFSGRIGWGSSGTGLVTVDGDGSQWHNAGSLTVGNAGTGTLEITDGGSVTTGSDAFVGENEDSSGTVTVTGAGSIWQIGGRLDIGYDASSLSNGGVGILHIQPGGTVNATQGTAVSLGDQLSLEGGTLSTTQISFPDGGNPDTNFEWTSGTLHVGQFLGDLDNQAGVLAPGNSVGITNIQGNYNQLADATLEIHVGGTTPVSQYDSVRVTGNAFLGGDLELALVNGFVPSSANTFTILHADLDLFSAFANVANGQRLTTSDGLGSFLVNYGPGSAFDPDQIVLSAFLPGDYNGDGTVNAADYVVWRKNDGTQAGYDTWRANFGRTAGSGLGANANAGVPEPATLIMLAGVLIGCSIAVARRSHKLMPQ